MINKLIFTISIICIAFISSCNFEPAYLTKARENAESRDPELREDAFAELAKRGKESIPLLEELLIFGSDDTVREASFVLCDMGKDGIDSLIKPLFRTRKVSRRAAEFALYTICKEHPKLRRHIVSRLIDDEITRPVGARINKMLSND